MKYIPLTQGKEAVVDDEDYDRLIMFKWYAHHNKGKWYALRTIGRSHHQAMHQLLMPCPRWLEVDHRDRDGLNNQKNNLRICTHAQNVRNGWAPKANKSGFKGVSWKKSHGRWCAQIHVFNKVIHLGLFHVAKDAAKAYDAAATQYHGQFALTNQNLGLLNEA